MDPEDVTAIEALFEEALELPEEDRLAWLKDATDNPEVLREVEALLRASARTGVLEAPSPPRAADLLKRLEEEVPHRAAPVPPTRVGPYRILREVGRGGMASVYLAERDDGEFQQRVAVKVLRTPWEGEELASRLMAERQILAQLRHPNIARLLDGGVTQDGRPFLVMEFVQGLPIDRYCDENRLEVDARLRLMASLARAVHHAHRNLVVHRDLKPTNILVTATGEARLVDFGIAKILDPALVAAGAPVTRTGYRPMTPEYAAPEQIRDEAVTTATDIYGLGVVLYELLSGRRPFARADRSLKEVEQAVLEEEPVRPSAAASRAWAALGDRGGPGREEIAAARSTTPERLRRRLEGDLDNIVLMALRKEPERRYSSALQLAEELERHLEGSPVHARGDSPVYRLGKFVRRRWWGVAAVASLLVLLTGYAATVTIQSRRIQEALEQARLEAEKSEQVTRLLMGLFEGGATPGGGVGGTPGGEVGARPGEEGTATPDEGLTTRELLDRGMARAEAMQGQPAVQAQMLDVVGRIHRYLGQYDEGAPVLERALELRRELYGPEHAAVGESMLHLADLYWSAGRLDEAEALFRQALQLERRLYGEQHPRIAQAMNGLHLVLRDQGAYEAALPLVTDALEMRRRLLGDGHPDVAESLNYVGALLRRMGRFEDAEPHYRAALDLRRELLGDEHPEVAESLNNLALHMSQTGRLEQAAPLFRQALDGYRRAFGPDHPFVATVMHNLGGLRTRTGDFAGADTLLRQALDIRRRRMGEDSREVAASLRLLGDLRRQEGAHDEAVALYREAVARFTSVHRHAHPSTASALVGLGRTWLASQHPDSAVAPLQEAWHMQDSLLGPDHISTLSTRIELARALGLTGRSEQKRDHLLAVLGDAERRRVRDPAVMARAAGELVRLLDGAGRPELAAQWRELAALESTAPLPDPDGG